MILRSLRKKENNNYYSTLNFEIQTIKQEESTLSQQQTRWEGLFLLLSWSWSWQMHFGLRYCQVLCKHFLYGFYSISCRWNNKKENPSNFVTLGVRKLFPKTQLVNILDFASHIWACDRTRSWSWETLKMGQIIASNHFHF